MRSRKKNGIVDLAFVETRKNVLYHFLVRLIKKKKHYSLFRFLKSRFTRYKIISSILFPQTYRLILIVKYYRLDEDIGFRNRFKAALYVLILIY